jgi:hypothetical protein
MAPPYGAETAVYCDERRTAGCVVDMRRGFTLCGGLVSLSAADFIKNSFMV